MRAYAGVQTAEMSTRGVVATQCLAAKEATVSSPAECMLTPVHAQSLSDIGHMFTTEASLLRNDSGLTEFIMHEMLLYEESFFRLCCRLGEALPMQMHKRCDPHC